MIVKIIDAYFYTKLSQESARTLLEKLLDEHIRELSDFDAEHFAEMLEESDKFEKIDESVEKVESADLEYTQDEIDEFVDSIIEEEYDVESEEEDEEEDEYYEDYEDEEEDSEDESWE